LSITIKNYSNKDTATLFNTAVYLDSRGLSRDGQNHLAHLGLSLSCHTFTRLLKSQTELYQTALNNYNKGYRRLLLKKNFDDRLPLAADDVAPQLRWKLRQAPKGHLFENGLNPCHGNPQQFSEIDLSFG